MLELPEGTVTFLFTDIEGSTRLWEEQPEAMREALARHDALAAEAIARHAGLLLKSRGEGDSLFAVFPQATDAIAAAATLQQAFVCEAWPTPTPLRVRMALHTGEANQRDGDFYGPVVNRCARLRAAAHGGQVLLSEATQSLVRDLLPPGAALKSLGSHRLRDLQHPEQVFQLLHPDLPSDFPALHSLNTHPNNLPQALTSFIGREKEMAEVKERLAATRLLTLTGVGGTGKTRLSLQVAAEVGEQYADGAWLVELAPLADPSLVPQAVAAVLSVPEQPGQDLIQVLVQHLKSRHLLLILDNCEHLLRACADLAEHLLRQCPHVRLLASSREGLGIAGETLYRIPSLSLPDPRSLPLGGIDLSRSLMQYEAVRLFLDRAGAVQPGFTLTSANASAVREVCQRLDGIPLALELAAARVRALPVEEITSRLNDRFRLLTGGSRTALPRQQTLRALIDWSHDLLAEPERVLLRRLSVFAGGWTLAAAEAVGSGDGIETWEVLDRLTVLVDKSLVQYEEREGRYRLLETIRQYSRERLLEAGEGEGVRGRHLQLLLRLAEEAEPELWGADQGVWLERLEVEHDNFRVALEWGMESEPEVALRLAGALGYFWDTRGHWTEGRHALERALDRAAQTPLGLQAKALERMGFLALRQGELDAAKPPVERSVAFYRAVGEQRGLARALSTLGVIAGQQNEGAAAWDYFTESERILRGLPDKRGIAAMLLNAGGLAVIERNYEKAQQIFAESLAVAQQQGDRRNAAMSLHGLAEIASLQGDPKTAHACLEQCLALGREVGYKAVLPPALADLAALEIQEGNNEAARSLLEESLVVSRETGQKWMAGRILQRLGIVARRRADWEEARAFYAERLALLRGSGDRLGIAEVLEGLAKTAAGEGKPARAARLLGAAEMLGDAPDVPFSSVESTDREQSVAAVRAALGEEAFASAWAEGRAMSLEQATEYALEEPADA